MLALSVSPELTKDDLLGDLLYTTAMMYLAELDVMDHIQSRGMNLRSVRIPSETVFKTSLAVQESFGVPTSASATGLAMDADRLLSVDKAMDGDAGLKVRFLQSSGMNSSALEHSVPEQLWSTPGSPAEGVSAVKAIQIAMEQGIPIYTVTRDNIATVMPVLSLDAEVKSAITDAVNAGMEVTVPQTNINFHGTAVVGYIAIDPETGAGAYMISGGDSGAKVVAGVLTATMGLFTGDWKQLANGTKTLFTGIVGVLGFWKDYISDCYLAPISENPQAAMNSALAMLGGIAAPLKALSERKWLHLIGKHFFPQSFEHLWTMLGKRTAIGIYATALVLTMHTLFSIGMGCEE
jgi:hypothetical protein